MIRLNHSSLKSPPPFLHASQCYNCTLALFNEKLLVSFLHEHFSASEDESNFKMATFQAAVTILKSTCTMVVQKLQRLTKTSGLLDVLLHLTFSSILTAYSNTVCSMSFRPSSTRLDGIDLNLLGHIHSGDLSSWAAWLLSRQHCRAWWVHYVDWSAKLCLWLFKMIFLAPLISIQMQIPSSHYP